MNKHNELWSKIFECSCGAEVIAISHDDADRPYLNMAFFNQGFHGIYALTWRERLRQIWVILTKGTLWADVVVLEPYQCYKLGKELLNQSVKLSEIVNKKAKRSLKNV